MGRGDLKSRRGKISRGTYGKTRSRSDNRSANRTKVKSKPAAKAKK
ncbi:MAG: 30S ribosomal protein THX [Cyclobacteriaceae bacterium]|nr:30S ribosomal protein THX [Cyclobacteriaceae bacterium]MCH8517669.1 30S ribosomal protein THX [Cyclobacteriaceae bacterium]